MVFESKDNSELNRLRLEYPPMADQLGDLELGTWPLPLFPDL